MYRAVRMTDEVTLHLRPAGLGRIEDDSRQRRKAGKGPEAGPGIAVEDERPETRCVKHLAPHLWRQQIIICVPFKKNGR